MASWAQVVVSEAEFAERVQRVFDAHLHKTLATLRKDGAPRISGIEAKFADGELWLGMMPGSRKALDLRHDPRLALHSAMIDVTMAQGDAKIAGRGVEILDPATIRTMNGEAAEDPDGQLSHLFRVDVSEVVLTSLGEPADHLVIEIWREGREFQRIQRR